MHPTLGCKALTWGNAATEGCPRRDSNSRADHVIPSRQVRYGAVLSGFLQVRDAWWCCLVRARYR